PPDREQELPSPASYKRDVSGDPWGCDVSRRRKLGRRGRTALAVTGAVVLLGGLAGPSLAFHLYRLLANLQQPGHCTAASGQLGDAVSGSAATVLVMHNTFNDTASGSPVTHIKAGESVTW